MGQVLHGVSSGLQKISSSPGAWATISNLWASNPKEAQARLILLNLSTIGSYKTMNMLSKDLKSNVLAPKMKPSF
jgi:hypothetical protein